MLPIYKAVSFHSVLKGGSTRPWLVLVDKNSRPKPYVVKLYKSENVDRFHFIAKEVYASVLADKFGIKTPPPALIEFPEHFRSSLAFANKQFLHDRNTRLNFSTELIEASFPFQMELHRDYLWKYDVETLYAFDNLIKNGDRTDRKPNLLMRAQDLFVIDHESAFSSVNDQTVEMFDQNQWVYHKGAHIFFRFLRDRGVSVKRTFFKEFLQVLNSINMDILDPYHEQLLEHQLDDELHYHQIKEYLCHMQRNSEKLVQILRGELG